MLSLLIFLPFLAALASLIFRQEDVSKWLSLAVAALTSLLSLGLWLGYDLAQGGFQYVQDIPWLSTLGINLNLAADGLSLPFLFLSALLTLIAILSEWQRKDGAIFSLFMLLEAALMGVFASLDLIIFFIAFELALIPMFFIIGVWGYDNRRYASLKFLLYSLVGSVFLLIGILSLGFLAGDGGVSFDYRQLLLTAPLIAKTPALLICLALSIAFLIKLPSVPFHTWLPHAHTQAPTGGSIMLAGLLLKMGGYGLIRFNVSLFPEAMQTLQPFFALLAVLSLLYGGMVALGQSDLKQLIAYSSVNHMGFVLLGIASLTAFGLHGAVYQMVAHGVITGLLFLLIGMLSHRTHTRSIAALKGMYTAMPILGGLMWLAMLGGAGIPGMAGFIGEFQAILGAFQNPSTSLWAVLGAFGILVNAALMLWTIQRVLQGEPSEQMKANYDLHDITSLELLSALPLILLALIWGFLPQSLSPYIDVGVQSALSQLGF
ncbi:MAG: NADH-quinone oxidoreductase subunit M [Deinococcales bacterium]